MKLSNKMIEFLEKRTDDNGYISLAPRNRASKGHAVSVRFLNEEKDSEGKEQGPSLIIWVDLTECQIDGMSVYCVFTKEKKSRVKVVNNYNPYGHKVPAPKKKNKNTTKKFYRKEV